MPAVTRNGDISIGVCSVGAPCCPHVWVSVHFGGSGDVLTNNQGTMRIGDNGASSCPHCPIWFAVSGSPNVMVNGRSVHRLGDAHNVGCGSGSVVSASPNVIAN